MYSKLSFANEVALNEGVLSVSFANGKDVLSVPLVVLLITDRGV